MILLAYAVEGRKNVQATSLDALFSFAGACMLIAAGGTYFIFNTNKIQIYAPWKSLKFKIAEEDVW